MNPPNFLFAPLERHFDYGFGGIAEAFKDAADDLAASEEKRQRPQAHLPANFLYRQAVELYLKSMVVVLHRRLRIPFGETPYDGEPRVPDRGEWMPFHRVHSVAALYSQLRNLLDAHASRISELSRTDWKGMEECDAWIDTIHRCDPSSTLSRYPLTKNKEADREKSSFKPTDCGELFGKMGPGGPYVKGFVLLDEYDRPIEAFEYDAHPIPELRNALVKCVEVLSNAHFAMRCELAAGW